MWRRASLGQFYTVGLFIRAAANVAKTTVFHITTPVAYKATVICIYVYVYFSTVLFGDVLYPAITA